jgi:hypothetical protein
MGLVSIMASKTTILFLILKGRKNKNEIEIDWKELNESAP